MMNIKDQNIKEQLKGFDAVWRRVNSSKKNPHRSAEECGLKLLGKKDCKKPPRK